MKYLLIILIGLIALCRARETLQTTIEAVEKENVVLKCPIDTTSEYMDEYDYDYDDLERKKRQNPITIIQWYKDSVKLNKFTNIGKYEFDGTELRILNVDSMDAGNYTCKMINGLGQLGGSISIIIQTTNSTTKTLQITKSSQTRKRLNMQRAPTFVTSNQITKFSKQKGEEVMFNCRAVGVPRPDILWFKNGVILSEEEYGITRSKWSLNLKDLRTNDNGNFTCQVFNKHGSINATFELNVFDESQVFEGLEPINITISSGMDAVFTCKVKSTYNPNIKWMKQISKVEYTNYVIQNSNNDLLKNKELSSNDLKSLYLFNSLPSLKFKEKNTQNKEYDDTLLKELITGKESSDKDELNFEFFVPKDIDFDSTTRKIETKNDDSIHYITLSSSPSVIQKFSYDRINNYYISQLTIKQASVKESGIYVCFGATNNGYSYRKSYLQVMPLIQTVSNFHPNGFYGKFNKKDNYKDDIYFNNKPEISTKANLNDNFITIQSIGYIIIGIPVILISIFALISVCYLKKIENLKEDKIQNRNSIFRLFKSAFKSGKSEKNCEKISHTLNNSYDEKKMNSYAKNTLSTSASSDHTNTLQCVASSLATSMSDSSSETTVAYYATIPLLAENVLSPPPLPNSQPPTFSPVLVNPTSAKYYGQTNELKRVESNSSMAYYKIVDSESIPYNQANNKYSSENDQQVVTEYKLNESTNSNRFYFQLAPVNKNIRSFSNTFNKKY